MPRNILITGAGGSLGTSLMQTLKDLEYNPIGLSSQRKKGLETLDINNRTQLEAVFEKYQPEEVIHLAAKVSQMTEADLESSNLLTENLSLLCKHFGVKKLLFASSAAVYGDKGDNPYIEVAELQEPVQMYAQSKLDSERIIQNILPNNNIILRIFNIYGPRFNNSLINRLVSGESIQLNNNPQFVRDYIHVDRVTEIIVNLLESKINGTVVNVGEGSGWTNKDLVKHLEKQGVKLNYTYVEGGKSYSVADTTYLQSLVELEKVNKLIIN